MAEGDAAAKPHLKVVGDSDTAATDADAALPPNETADGAAAPAQAEMPFAVVQGEAVTELPQDLYIPPHALEVFLEAFEGPLDLLLYLIRRQNLDILNIPINEITRQYVEYIDLMKELQLDLVGEYLLMAAMLAEIKSRMLLPRAEEDEEDEDDPRAELVRRLLEYERYKKAADQIVELPRMERDTFQASAEPMERKVAEKLPDLQLKELLIAFKDVLARAEMLAHHHIQAEPLSVRQRMSEVLERVRSNEFIEFKDLFDPAEGRMGVCVTFLSLLELLKEALIELAQTEPYSPIHVRAAGNVKAVPDLPDSSEFDEPQTTLSDNS
jgi:segregation and condensation protein A